MQENPKYKTTIAVTKAAGDTAVGGGAGGIASFIAPVVVNYMVTGGLLPEELAGQAVGLIVALIGAGAVGLKRFLRNRKKNKWVGSKKPNSTSSLPLPILAALVGLVSVLGMCVSGCITTRGPDGSVEIRWDSEATLTTLQFAYLIYERERVYEEGRDALEDAEAERARQERLQIVRSLAEAARAELERQGLRIPVLSELEN